MGTVPSLTQSLETGTQSMHSGVEQLILFIQSRPSINADEIAAYILQTIATPPQIIQWIQLNQKDEVRQVFMRLRQSLELVSAEDTRKVLWSVFNHPLGGGSGPGQENFPLSLWMFACMLGRREILIELAHCVQQGDNQGHMGLVLALKAGHRDLVKEWKQWENFESLVEVMYEAASRGYLSELEDVWTLWFAQHQFTEPQTGWEPVLVEIVSRSASHGHISILDWVYTYAFSVLVTPPCIGMLWTQVAQQGNVTLWQWLYNRGLLSRTNTVAATRTVLHYLSQWNQCRLMEQKNSRVLLLDMVDIADEQDGNTALHIAAKRGHTEALHQCVLLVHEKAAQQQQPQQYVYAALNRLNTREGMTPLLLAVRYMHVQTVRYLLDLGDLVDVHATDSFCGRTVLHWNPFVEIIEQLYKQPPSALPLCRRPIQAPDRTEKQRSPLMVALMYLDLATSNTSEELDPLSTTNQADPDNNMLRKWRQKTANSVCKMLIAHATSEELCHMDTDGNSTLHYAIRYNNGRDDDNLVLKIIKKISEKENVGNHIKTATNKDGQAAFLYACHAGNPPNIRTVFCHDPQGYSVFYKTDHNGDGPLFLAIKRETFDEQHNVMKYLCEDTRAGGSIVNNLHPITKQTVSMYIVQATYVPLIANRIILLELMAKMNANWSIEEPSTQRTILHIAVMEAGLDAVGNVHEMVKLVDTIIHHRLFVHLLWKKDKDGRDVLWRTIESNQYKLAQWLLESFYDREVLRGTSTNSVLELQWNSVQEARRMLEQQHGSEFTRNWFAEIEEHRYQSTTSNKKQRT